MYEVQNGCSGHKVKWQINMLQSPFTNLFLAYWLEPGKLPTPVSGDRLALGRFYIMISKSSNIRLPVNHYHYT